MKKKHLIYRGLIVMFTLLLVSCQKKDDLGLTKPGYKTENGTGGNPIKGPVVTSTPTPVNPATQNSNLLVGGAGWSNPTCASSNTTLKGFNGNVEVTLTFQGTPVSGTYAIASSPSALVCTILVKNAPNQPAGVIWLGQNGSVVVNNNASNNSINASFTGIVCVQETFSFPQVSVSGVVACN